VKALTFLAKRFVAGEHAADAVRAGERLQARGIKSTFDLLGEDVLDRDAARRLTAAIQELLRLIPATVERNVSIKLSMTGLNIDRDFCLEQTAAILDVAREVKGFVRIDMEGSKHTQATLDVFRAVRQRYDNVGIVLQAYLHRTEADVLACIEHGDRVRLCKGAYKEPPSAALQKMDDIRANFKKLARMLLERGNYPAIATHDESLVQDALGYVEERGIPRERYEFQMLYGLRARRWDELIAAGHNVRIYVPYGTHWFPYFYRRLRERKENVFFVLRGLFE
jgi:proline dehydrogenase